MAFHGAIMSIAVGERGAMPKLRDAYGNSASTGYTIDFFSLNAPSAKQAYLASPFVTIYEPVRLLTSRGCEVRIIVRLCSITPPPVLKQLLDDPLVVLRYYTSRSFHAKLYIIDDVALVGSANLTSAGLQTNREVSVVLRRDQDPAFEDLPVLFDAFWEFAGVYSADVHSQYELAYRKIATATEEQDFQDHIERVVTPANPPSAKAGSNKMTPRRSFIEALRRKYDESIIPAFREVQALFEGDDRRRPEYARGDVEIELSRSLGWVRVQRAPGETWKQSPIGQQKEDRAQRIVPLIDEWHAIENLNRGDMVEAEREVGNIEGLREAFGDEESLTALTYDELFAVLTGCHAFHDMLRFSAGGLPGLKQAFLARNTLPDIKSTLSYLLHGPGTQLDRAYDCIHDESRKLGLFGEHCVMELVGWMDQARPPINGRTIKALRFMGFGVRD